MYIPEVCPKLIVRSFTDEVTSVGDSFKSWDNCMHGSNKTCKIVAIVCFVLAGLLILWVVSTLIRCCCLGLSCLEALCCCCRGGSSRGYHEKQVPYNNPNMYGPPVQPAYQPSYEPSYQPSVHQNHHGYQPVDPFQDTRTAYRGNY